MYAAQLISNMRTQQAKLLSLPDLLERLGHKIVRKSSSKFWYCSPLRSENRPSFCVEPGRKTAWIFSDYGANIKGNILDFVMCYQQCDVKEALLWLEQIFGADASTAAIEQQSPESTPSPIRLYRIKQIQHPALLSYIKKRAIEIDLAKRYLREVHYRNGERSMFALGWKTDSGGWCLRAKGFKASVRPAGITTIGRNSRSLAVFEGVFDLIAAISYYKAIAPKGQAVILNSISNLHLVTEKIQRENYQSIKLYLDNDSAGRQATRQLLLLKNTQDCSAIFSPAKDFAEFYEMVMKGNNLFSLPSQNSCK
jgi:DNA primase